MNGLAEKNNAWVITIAGIQAPGAWTRGEVQLAVAEHGSAVVATRFWPMYDARTKAALGYRGEKG